MKTISNKKGGNWPSTCALYLADWITVKQCTYDPAKNPNSPAPNSTVLESITRNTCASDIASTVRYTIMKYFP